MPNVKSAEKRMRQNERRRTRNRTAKSAMRTAIKKAKTNPQSEQAVQTALTAISRTAKRGIIHHKTAARLTSRLQLHVNRASTAA